MKATIYEGNKTFTVIEKEIEQPATGEVRIKVAFVGVCVSSHKDNLGLTS